MSIVGIRALAYTVRIQSASLPKPVALGHAQQLVAAALGYKSLAAYQASQEERPDLSGTEHIVIDDDVLRQRAQELGVGDACFRLANTYSKKTPVPRLIGADRFLYVSTADLVQTFLSPANKRSSPSPARPP
ncbi:hypothetical protein [Ralstonia sp. 24A2]|uniref:hypothetical protein n=1 Tax=Ralstonia sp. 24A2 TaxID=3447364 RepID=UPI003F698B6B